MRCPDEATERCQLEAGHSGDHKHHSGAVLRVWPPGWSSMSPVERMSWKARMEFDDAK